MVKEHKLTVEYGRNVGGMRVARIILAYWNRLVLQITIVKTALFLFDNFYILLFILTTSYLLNQDLNDILLFFVLVLLNQIAASRIMLSVL